jgi:tetratricopeptide repeat protein 25
MAIFRKAEALYSKGDFEMALVFYHRGLKERPEVSEFRLGIQKAREAIENAIGHPEHYKFKPPPGVKLMPKSAAAQGRAKSANARMINRGSRSGSLAWISPKVAPPPGFQLNMAQKQKVPVKTDKSAKQLLGELYTDKEYLDKLMNDKGNPC